MHKHSNLTAQESFCFVKFISMGHCQLGDYIFICGCMQFPIKSWKVRISLYQQITMNQGGDKKLKE